MVGITIRLLAVGIVAFIAAFGVAFTMAEGFGN